MPPTRHVALLRGLNVGGRNVVRMADLRAAFEGMGLADVRTYIQSGNVVFAAARRPGRARLERGLEEALGVPLRLVLLDAPALAEVVAQAPAGFGDDHATHRYDVIYVRAPLTPTALLQQLRPQDGVDAAHAGDRALYFRRVIARAAQSRLQRITALPAYADVTIRNWKTTVALLRMASGET